MSSLLATLNAGLAFLFITLGAVYLGLTLFMGLALSLLIVSTPFRLLWARKRPRDLGEPK